MSSTTSPSTGAALLTVIESDLLTHAGTPLLTLIEALNAAHGDPFAITAAWGQFVGNIQPALIAFEQQVAAQILAAIQLKLVSAITAAQAKAAALPALGATA